MQPELEKYGPIVSNENFQSKLNHLAKEHFQINVRNDFDYLNSVKESIRFYSLDLPAEIKEIFIPYSEAPIFWIYESPLLNQVEEFLRFNLARGSYAELHKSIKDNYTKWVTTKLKSEKEYFATTTMNFCERDINKHNFFKMIIKGIIYSYQSTFYNPPRAIEMFKNALEIINGLRINDQMKNELKYVMNLYLGFIFLKENDYEKANYSFKDAIDIKPQGSTAKLYCVITEMCIGNEESSAYLLREVINFDLQRLMLAIKTNNPGMFSYFFRNAFVYNLFNEKDFSKAYKIVEMVLEEFKYHDSSIFTKCRGNLEYVKSKKYQEYFDDEIKKSISFCEKIIQNYNNSTNTLFYALYPEFHNKFESIIEYLVLKVKERFYKEVKEKVSYFDLPIQENLSTEKHLLEELENFKTKSKENLATSIKDISNNYDAECRAIEERINGLPNEDRFNPRVSMSNNMTYNIIIAFIVFFIGGVAGYSNKSVSDTSEFNSIFMFVLTSGSKWGAISFFVGLVISIVISGIVLIERADVKQKLQRKISFLKLEKDKTIADTKEVFVHKEKIMNESISNSVAQHKKRAEDLMRQREQTEKELMKSAEENINAVISGFVHLQSERQHSEEVMK